MSTNIKFKNSNLNKSQVIVGKGNTVNAWYANNEKEENELDSIIKTIMKNVSALDKERADELIDIVNLVKDEFGNPEPKAGRLRNCVTLIAPMITIANGIPVLVSSLQKLMDYISLHIK